MMIRDLDFGSSPALSSLWQDRILRQDRVFALISPVYGDVLAFVAILLLFLISPAVLFQLGYNYEQPGGNPFEKIHPGTVLACLALLMRIAALPHPLGGSLAVLVGYPGLTALACGWLLLLMHIVIVQKAPFTPIIDTFLLPIVLFTLVTILSRDWKPRLALALHLIFSLNALIALAEYLTSWRLTPYVAGALEIETDWRATALLGHPLSNAALTGCYLILLAMGAPLGKGAIRLCLIGLQLLAMVAFGGRAGLVMVLAVLSLIGIGRAFLFLAGRRVSLLGAAGAAIMLAMVPSLLIAAYEAGFLDRLIDRFQNDQGSAQTRLTMFKLFEGFTWRDLIIGPDPSLLDSLRRFHGLEFGIESFWIAFLLSYGIAVSVIFFLALGFFCRELVRRSGAAGAVTLVYFFAVASTSVSLSAKSAILGMLSVMVLILLDPKSEATLYDDRIKMRQ